MKLIFSLMVIMTSPPTNIEPTVVPYFKQPPSNYVLELTDKYATSEECQKKALELNAMAGQPLPKVQGRIAGAHCAVKPVGGK